VRPSNSRSCSMRERPRSALYEPAALTGKDLVTPAASNAPMAPAEDVTLGFNPQGR